MPRPSFALSWSAVFQARSLRSRSNSLHKAGCCTASGSSSVIEEIPLLEAEPLWLHKRSFVILQRRSLMCLQERLPFDTAKEKRQ